MNHTKPSPSGSSGATASATTNGAELGLLIRDRSAVAGINAPVCLGGGRVTLAPDRLDSDGVGRAVRLVAVDLGDAFHGGAAERGVDTLSIL